MSQQPNRLRSLRSMTGYAAASAQYDGVVLSVTLRSVNHRHLDLRVHLPEPLLPLEAKMRSLLQEHNPRGHLDLSLSVETAAGGQATVDEALLCHYLETFRRIGDRYGIPASADLATLSQLPGVLVRRDALPSLQITPELEAAVLKAVAEAVGRWDAMRMEEAARLAEDLRIRLSGIQQAVAKLEQWQQEKLPEAQKRLAERLQTLAGEAALDPVRLAQEALLLASRTDATEEILRLKAHVEQFAESLEGEADAGRKLDFLLQEMQREAGTLMAKVAGLGEVSLPMTRTGLEIKAEIEKLREQVQNLQ